MYRLNLATIYRIPCTNIFPCKYHRERYSTQVIKGNIYIYWLRQLAMANNMGVLVVFFCLVNVIIITHLPYLTNATSCKLIQWPLLILPQSIPLECVLFATGSSIRCHKGWWEGEPNDGYSVKSTYSYLHDMKYDS